MSDAIPTGASEMGEEPLLDSLLRDAVPEIKLALGELIDRDNARSLPDRYARLLPETTLAVVLRPDAAEAIRPVAAELEREITDSCMRHGSLYDRNYRVKLRQADSAGAPLFRVAVLTPEQAKAQAAEPTAPSSGPSPDAGGSNATVLSPPPRPSTGPDADATRIDRPPARPAPPHGLFALVMEDLEGKEQTRFLLGDGETTVGRRSEDPSLRSTIMLPEVPHVSRRQLALLWDPAGDEPPFRVYNLGLNPVHVGDAEVPGANAGRGPLKLDGVPAVHATRVGAGVPMRIGEHGPVLRIVEQEPGGPSVDPDATRFG
ncbi:MAG: hypothetical protein JWM27_2668 [Gemmatimonadetes bacterium]|nr:hypothetical protein [Gemmatimonadota bacterium]